MRSDPPAQKPDAKAPVVKIKVQDAVGQVVRELEGPDRKGEGGDGWFGIHQGTLRGAGPAPASR